SIYSHPLLHEFGHGTLARAAFEFFIRQDYLYLKDFARALCLGGAKADTLETLAMFAAHASTVVQVEQTFHSNFALQLGLTVADLEATPAAPVTRAYTRHLLAVAYSGTLGETVAAVLPCYWIYWEAGKRLNQTMPADPIYATWIQAYANPAFGAHVEQQLSPIDRLASHASAQESKRMPEHFAHPCSVAFSSCYRDSWR